MSLKRLANAQVSEVFSGRLAPVQRAQEIIDEADLPDPMPRYIADVVQRARLWQSERAAVAAEIVDDLRAALDEGAGEPAEIIAEYGQPRAVARAIRRRFLRHRPLVWRLWRGLQLSVVGWIAALVAVYLFYAVPFWIREPKITRDYVAELNATVAPMPSEPTAWPAYREALIALRPATRAGTLGGAERPGEAGWTDTVATLEAHQAEIARLRDGAAVRLLGYVLAPAIHAEDAPLYNPNGDPAPPPKPCVPGLLQVDQPQLSGLRSVAQTLAADARRATTAGDAATACADIRAILGVARHARQPMNTLGKAISDSIVHIACTTARETLASGDRPIPARDLAGLASAFAGVTPDAAPSAYIASERDMQHDFAQRIFSDDGSGSGRLCYRGFLGLRAPGIANPRFEDRVFAALVGPVASRRVCTRQQYVAAADAMFDAVKAWTESPMWERGESGVASALAPYVRRRGGRLIGAMAGLGPALESVGTSASCVATQLDAVRAAIAAHRFHLAHSAWPESLDDLVPEFLPTVPIDRFDGQPLRYVVISDAPVIYSVGADLDDDNARPPTTETGRILNHAAMRWRPRAEIERLRAAGRITPPRDDDRRDPVVDGDWILFPPVPDTPADNE